MRKFFKVLFYVLFCVLAYREYSRNEFINQHFKNKVVVSKKNSKRRVLPKSFSEAATLAGYKTDITADELIALAKKEGYSENDVLKKISGTPWQKSQLVKDAVAKYYGKSKTSFVSSAAANNGNLSEQKPIVKKNNGIYVYNKSNDDFFEKTDELKVERYDGKTVLTYKDRDVVEIKYIEYENNSEVIDVQYYFDGNLIKSKKDAYSFLEDDFSIMERFEKYAKNKGFSVKNPLY